MASREYGLGNKLEKCPQPLLNPKKSAWQSQFVWVFIVMRLNLVLQEEGGIDRDVLRLQIKPLF